MRILVTLGQGYGNVIMATPLLRALSEMNHEVDALCESHWADTWQLLAGSSWLHEVVGKRTQLSLDIQNYDAVVRTVWHSQPFGWEHEIFPERLNLRLHHEATVNLTAAQALGYTGDLPEPFVATTLVKKRATERTTIALADPAPISPFWRRKRYPHFAETAARLLAAGYEVVLLGKDNDAALWDTYPAAVRRFCPADIRAAVKQLQQVDAFLGPDCGLAHIAGALGLPTYTIFGPTSEIKNRPLGKRVQILADTIACRPCQMTPRWEACEAFRCLSELTPKAVADTVIALLQKRTKNAERKGTPNA